MVNFNYEEQFKYAFGISWLEFQNCDLDFDTLPIKDKRAYHNIKNYDAYESFKKILDKHKVYDRRVSAYIKSIEFDHTITRKALGNFPFIINYDIDIDKIVVKDLKEYLIENCFFVKYVDFNQEIIDELF